MPKYSYTCHDCAHRFEVRLSYAEVDTVHPACPDCGSANCERGLSRVNLLIDVAGGGHNHHGSGCGGCSGGYCSTCGH